MNARKTLINLVTTYIIFQLNPLHAATAPAFTPEQQEQIGQIAADYLVNHPEILLQVSRKQQQERQQATLAVKVMDNQAALLEDKDTPVSAGKSRCGSDRIL
jgi:cytochrome c oxidase assembly factor CtaG